MSLTVQVFHNRIVDRGEHAAQFVFVLFQKRHAEALEVGAEAGTRHHADALCAQQVVHEAVVQVRGLAAPFLDLLLDNRVIDL